MQNKVFIDTIVKEASRAWAVRNLSSKAMQTLEGAGVLDRYKMAEGIARGNKSLADKMGITFIKNKDTKSFVANVSQAKTGEVPDKALVRYQANVVNRTSPYASHNVDGIAGSNGKYVITGNAKNFVNVVEDRGDISTSLANKLKGDKRDLKALNAYGERHEIYEHMERVRGGAENPTLFYSHTSPRVLMRESNDIRMAPKNVSTFLKKTRSADPGFIPTEKKSLKVLSKGYNYGDFANSKQMESAHNKWLSEGSYGDRDMNTGVFTRAKEYYEKTYGKPL